MKIAGKYPSTRLRRVRNSKWIRRLISENNLSTNDLILPIFVREGKNKKTLYATGWWPLKHGCDKINCTYSHLVEVVNQTMQSSRT